MSLLFKPIVGLAAVAAIAGVVGILLMTQPETPEASEPAPAEQPTPVAPSPEPEPEPVNEYVSPPAPESEWGVTNATVEDLVEGILLARDRNDLAWLARTMESTADRASLVEDDLLAAHRQYTWRSTDGIWAKVAQSWQERTYAVEIDGDRAELVMQVGGNLGALRMPFVRIDGAWYFAGI